MKQDRREFLKRSGCALGMTALATQFRHFGMMSAMAASAPATPPSDYRALVCVFLLGGNDGTNTIIPNHNDASISNYATYYDQRNLYGLAIPQNSLLPFQVPRLGNLSYGMHPSLGPGAFGNGLYELWGQNKLAIVGSVGTLAKPTTRAQMADFTHPKPYALYSHSDQTLQHQTGRSDLQIYSGWGGRLSDQRTGPDNPGALIPMITSIAGAQLFTAGQSTLPLAIVGAPTGLDEVLRPHGYDSSPDSLAQYAAFNALRTQNLSTEIIAAASRVTDQAITVNDSLQSYQEVSVAFPPSNIGNQLKQVARLIKKRGDLNVKRQIFFCQLGGFDTHNQQLPMQAILLSQMSQAMRAFYDEMVAQGLSDKVTQFTLSDFGRTLNPSGTGGGVGTDHGWANCQFVVGGAVTGSNFYGLNTSNGTPMPTLALDGPDDAEFGTGARGRFIPTASVEQYAATLSRWFGLPDANLINVFPNIGNFSNTNLGFMGPA